MTLWTPEHTRTLLPALAVMLIIAVLLRLLLKDKPLAVRMRPLQIVTVVLLLLELGKQVLSVRRGYDLYHLPFHFCSLFIFVLPLMAFYRGKHRQTVYGISAALCTSVLMLMLIYPSLIYSADNIRLYFSDFFSFHTVSYHNLVLFQAILILALRPHTLKDRGEWKKVMGFTLVFCLFSAAMAQLLKTNYNNFYVCNVPPLESLRQNVSRALGYGVTQGLYVVVVTLVNLGFVQLAYWLYRILRRWTACLVPVKDE